MTHRVLERKAHRKVSTGREEYRRLRFWAAIPLAALLTFGATALVPTPHDAIGWGVRGLLFLGMWWAVR